MTGPGGANRAATAAAVLAAVPVALVNIVAFAGQYAFLRAHLPWPWYGQLVMAVTLEAVAVYLAWQAHLAQLANDSALRLRWAAYAFAAVIAAMNYSHYAHAWRPTFAALAVGLCSAASPWLWGVHTRRVARGKLMAAGLVEPHALRLGVTRWAWHPLRSVRVMRAAAWDGVTDPRAAIAAVYAPGAAETVTATVTARPAGQYRPPSARDIMARQGCGPATAKKIKAEVALAVRAASNGHGG